MLGSIPFWRENHCLFPTPLLICKHWDNLQGQLYLRVTHIWRGPCFHRTLQKAPGGSRLNETHHVELQNTRNINVHIHIEHVRSVRHHFMPQNKFRGNIANNSFIICNKMYLWPWVNVPFLDVSRYRGWVTQRIK